MPPLIPQLMMDDFTGIVCVYNARAATELTLRTLLAVAKHFLRKIIVVDSSDDGMTSDFLLKFSQENPVIQYLRQTKRISHAKAWRLALEEEITTPYIFMSDSDVFHRSANHFMIAKEKFQADKEMFLVGMLQRKEDKARLSPKGIAPRILPWAIHMRTETARHYLDEIETTTRTVLEDGIEYIYDTGSFLFKKACLIDGLKYLELNMNHYVTHYMGFSHWADKKPEPLAQMYRDNVERQRKEVHKLLSLRIWEKLAPPKV